MHYRICLLTRCIRMFCAYHDHLPYFHTCRRNQPFYGHIYCDAFGCEGTSKSVNNLRVGCPRAPELKICQVRVNTRRKYFPEEVILEKASGKHHRRQQPFILSWVHPLKLRLSIFNSQYLRQTVLIASNFRLSSLGTT